MLTLSTDTVAHAHRESRAAMDDAGAEAADVRPGQTLGGNRYLVCHALNSACTARTLHTRSDRGYTLTTRSPPAPTGGSTAVVFEGVHLATSQHVALKVIADRSCAAALEREARCAAAVRHPHVARLLDAFSEEGRLVLVVRAWRCAACA